MSAKQATFTEQIKVYGIPGSGYRCSGCEASAFPEWPDDFNELDFPHEESCGALDVVGTCVTCEAPVYAGEAYRPHKPGGGKVAHAAGDCAETLRDIDYCEYCEEGDHA